MNCAQRRGCLDRAIDTWHEPLGRSEGIRPELPASALNDACRGASSIEQLRHSGSGLGGPARLGRAAEVALTAR